jgi:SAM-dependent methyltransferase
MSLESPPLQTPSTLLQRQLESLPFPTVPMPMLRPIEDLPRALAPAKRVEEPLLGDAPVGPLARWWTEVRRRASPREGLRRVLDLVGGAEDVQWSRVVMRRETDALIRGLNPPRLDALEISGDDARRFGFRTYRTASYPEYDVCAGPLPARFDLIVAEQVFEHLRWPYRAGRNVHTMLAPGGFALISTPFLVRIHEIPIDCTRWTETGLRHFLAECGFPLEKIRTGSWGNRACVNANFDRWTRYRRRFHSLRNEPQFPYHVWALAQK